MRPPMRRVSWPNVRVKMTNPAKLLLLWSSYFAIGVYPVGVAAQLVRQDNPAPLSGSASAKEGPVGKARLSQEIQITGEQSWSDTGITVEPGEHIVITASGRLRYADAKEDNGPDGLTRGYKDL